MAERRTPGYYGARVEAWVLERYGLDREYGAVDGAKLDAVEPESGRPVEIKAVGRNRSGGRATEVLFKIWRDQHRALRQADGYYVFVEYQLRSDGIAVLRSRSVRAGDVQVDSWYAETEPRGVRQAEVSAAEVFS